MPKNLESGVAPNLDTSSPTPLPAKLSPVMLRSNAPANSLTPKAVRYSPCSANSLFAKFKSACTSNTNSRLPSRDKNASFSTNHLAIVYHRLPLSPDVHVNRPRVLVEPRAAEEV
ncbi:hypothetical protein V3481_006800 [Fusarium oxysporum f. sp. vasinfectum]